jgi:demethylmenaquinone methyltransferase/2-methoxy-6-polyprenyl-1,4-benzoquinol methylase
MSLSAAETMKASRVREMFDSIAHRYDVGNSVLSFGIHHYWRRRLLGMVAKNPDGMALDVCTGTGDLLPLLKKKFGKTVVGVDFCLPMLECAEQKPLIKEAQATLIQGDGLCLPFADNTYDCITVSFGVRNFANLAHGLIELRRVLKPGASLLVLEFGQPTIPIFSQAYRLYSSVIMPRIGGLVTGNSSAYTYLPETARVFPCGDQFEAILSDAGLSPQRTLSLTGGIAFAYHAVKPVS